MGASDGNSFGAVERLRARISRLEGLLALHHIPIPRDEDGSLEADHLAFPELDFSEPERKPPEKVQVTAALEAFPHIAATLCNLWGQNGFDEYLGRLIVDERGDRKGFNMDAMEELLMLGRIARQRKALFGMFIEAKKGDVWSEVPEVVRQPGTPG